jgi:DNA gyrase subunit B
LSSPELRLLIEISKDLGAIHKSSFTVEDGGASKKVDDPQQLLDELMEKAKRGVTIQRYKGLGEMNPGQLWSTTMDPEKRTLLKVRIEDVVEADDVFTLLMGDKVEPRREFIQNNALEVKELDI